MSTSRDEDDPLRFSKFAVPETPLGYRAVDVTPPPATSNSFNPFNPSNPSNPTLRSDRDVKRALELITYKPNFRLDLNDYGYDSHRLGSCILRLRATVPNTYRPSETTEVYGHTMVSLPIELKEFLGLVRSAIHAFERHEADEWLRFDDDIVYDPHRRHDVPPHPLALYHEPNR